MKAFVTALVLWTMAMLAPVAAWCADGQFPAVVEAEVRSILAAERSGVLTRLTVDAGDRVRKNQELAEIFHRDLVLKKGMLEARRDYLAFQAENLQKLWAKGMVTDEEVARNKMEVAMNRSEIQAVETEIERSVIRSPFSGLVVTRHIQPHEWVTPGQPVVELYDPSRLRIVTDIPADMVRRIDTKRPYRFRFSALDRDVAAEVKVFFPQVDVRSNTVKIHWTVAEAVEGLIPGMKGVLQLESE